MNILDIVLSTQVIAGIIIVASVAMAVRSILFFTREASGMAPKLMKLDNELGKYRDGMGEKKKTVKELTVVVDPLREREGKLRTYYDGLKSMELEHDKQSSAAQSQEDEERKKRIQRKKMGFD